MRNVNHHPRTRAAVIAAVLALLGSLMVPALASAQPHPADDSTIGESQPSAEGYPAPGEPAGDAGRPADETAADGPASGDAAAPGDTAPDYPTADGSVSDYPVSEYPGSDYPGSDEPANEAAGDGEAPDEDEYLGIAPLSSTARPGTRPHAEAPNPGLIDHAHTHVWVGGTLRPIHDVHLRLRNNGEFSVYFQTIFTPPNTHSNREDRRQIEFRNHLAGARRNDQGSANYYVTTIQIDETFDMMEGDSRFGSGLPGVGIFDCIDSVWNLLGECWYDGDNSGPQPANGPFGNGRQIHQGRHIELVSGGGNVMLRTRGATGLVTGSIWAAVQDHRRHFAVDAGSVLTIREGVILDRRPLGASDWWGGIPVVGQGASNGGVEVMPGGTLNLRGGVIRNGYNHRPGSEMWRGGGGVEVHGAGAVLNMFAPSAIYNNDVNGDPGERFARGAGVAVRGGGTFNMYGGEIHHNIARGGQYGSGGGVSVTDAASTVNVFDGQIHHNTVNGFGGGVFVASGTFNLCPPEGAVCHASIHNNGRNGRDPWGMAVRVNTGGTFNMHGGTVSDHQAFGGGGAFLLEGGTVNMYQGYVRNNHARAGGGASAVTNGDHEGGAFLVQSGTLNISGGAIYNNTARHGGAIHVRGGEVNIFEQDDLDHFVGPVFTNNHARVSGGAIGQSFVATGGNAHTGGTVNIGGGWLTTNTAAVSGGGIWSLQGPTRTGALNLSGGLLRDNSAVRGGGAFLQGGTSTFTGGRFEENQAGHAGGGIYLHAATLHVTGVTFDGNSAVNGGGVKVSQSSTLHATDSSFVDNRANLATGRGGAIHLGANPHLHLAGTEVLGNWAALGGGIGMSAEDYERITISHDPLAAPTVFNHNLAEGSRWYLREDLVPIHQANITIPLGQGMFSARTVGTPSGFFNHAYNNYDIQYPALPEPPAPELTVLHSSDYDVSRTDHRTRAEVPGTHPSGDSGEHEVTLTITNSGNTTLVDLDFTQEPGSDAFYTAWVCGQDDEPIAAFLTGLILFPGESVVCTATINHVPADGSHLSLVRVDAQTPQLIVEDTTVVLSATAADEWEAFVDEPLFDPPTDWMSLPFTGGCGPLPWTLAGLAGAAVLGALFYQRRRRPTGEAA